MPLYTGLHPLVPHDHVHPLQVRLEAADKCRREAEERAEKAVAEALAAHAAAATAEARKVELEQELAQQVRQREARLQLRATSRYMHPLTSITLLLTLHPRA